jgi:hypothetical protein
MQHVRFARDQRRDQAIGDSQLAAQADGGGLLDEHRVWTAVDDPAVESIGVNDAARTVGCFEDPDTDAASL